MSNAKKRLEAALKKTNELPDTWFGNEKASFEDLPSIQKNRRVRKNIYVEQSTVEVLEKICEKHKVSFTEIANDILTNYVKRQENKKA